MIVRIEKADYKGDFTIHFLFSDKKELEIDFSAFLKSAKNPMVTKYLDKKLFKNFTLEDGDIHWNEYELCFPIWDLHEGKV